MTKRSLQTIWRTKWGIFFGSEEFSLKLVKWEEEKGPLQIWHGALRWLNPALNPSLAYSSLGGIEVQLAVLFILVNVVYSPLGRIEFHLRNLVYPGHPGLTRGRPVGPIHSSPLACWSQALGCAWRSRRLANCRLPGYIA